MHQPNLSSRGGAFAVVILFGLVSAIAMAKAPDSQLLDTPDINLLYDGAVRAVAYMPDGSLVVGGSFTYINGQKRRSLARILATGEVDPDWKPEPDNMVTALAVDAAGNVYVGGWFNQIGGGVHNYMSKIPAGSTGQADPLWPSSWAGSEPVRIVVSADAATVYVATRNSVYKISSTGTVASEWGRQIRGDVYDIALGGDGSLYVAGSNLLPVVRQWRLLRVSVEGIGEIDTTWDPQPSDRVNALAVDKSTHSLIVGGVFTQIGGQAQANLARIPFSSNGAIDLAWRPKVGGRVFRLSNVADGKLFAHFYDHLIPPTWQGRLCKLDVASGMIDPDWHHDVISGKVLAMEIAPEKPLAVGGWSMSVAGVPSYNLALLPASGDSVLPTIEAGVKGSAYVIARQPDGGTILGGMFSWAGGMLRSNLLRLKPDGMVDPNWDPAPDNSVNAIQVDAENNVFVGGSFRSIGGKLLTGLARISGSGAGLVQPLPSVGDVYTLLYDGLGTLFVGGHLDEMEGQPIHGLIKVVRSSSGDWQIDESWAPQTSSAYDLTLDASRNLYAAVAEGATIGVRRVSADGSGQLDAGWTFPVEGTVYTLALDSSQRLYVGGDFILRGGAAQINLARVEAGATAVLDAAWSPQVAGRVSALAIGADGSVYVGGRMIISEWTSNAYLSRFDGTGAGLVDSNWISDFASPGWEGGYVSSILSEPDNRILVGGLFAIGNQPTRLSFAAFGDSIFAGGFGVPPAD